MADPEDPQYWDDLIKRAREAWSGAVGSARDVASSSPDVFIPPMPPAPAPPPATEPRPPAGKYVEAPQPDYDPNPMRRWERERNPEYDEGDMAALRQLMRAGVPMVPMVKRMQSAGAIDTGEEMDEPAEDAPPPGLPNRPTLEEAEYQWSKTHPQARRGRMQF